MGNVLLIGPRETSLDAQSASLVEHIRTSLIIQAEMFRRILDGDPPFRQRPAQSVPTM
jgi:hypothetical protein